MTAPTPHAASRPLLSVVVPTRDRPAALRACLASLAAQEGAREALEVIVVDDGSRQPAAAVAAEMASMLVVRTVRQANAGPAAARNAGARLASAAWLAFLDDDCRVAPGWLTALLLRCEQHPGAMLGGAVENALAHDRFAICHQLLLDYVHRRWNAAPATAAFCASCNLAVPAADFRAVGAFDATFPYPAAEDRDLCDRWRRSGRPLVQAPEVAVQHAHAMTARLFWRQHFGYGRGARRLHVLRSRRDPAARCREAPSFYLGLLLQPLRDGATPRTLTLFLLVLLSQVATACGYATEALLHRTPPIEGEECFS